MFARVRMLMAQSLLSPYIGIRRSRPVFGAQEEWRALCWMAKRWSKCQHQTGQRLFSMFDRVVWTIFVRQLVTSKFCEDHSSPVVRTRWCQHHNPTQLPHRRLFPNHHHSTMSTCVLCTLFIYFDTLTLHVQTQDTQKLLSTYGFMMKVINELDFFCYASS